MKSFLKYIVIIALAAGMAYFMNTYLTSSSLLIENPKKDYSIKLKGLSDVVCFDIEDNGNIIIAQKKKISLLKMDGTTSTLIKTNDDNIISMVENRGKIYYIQGNKLICFDINTGDKEELIKDIPIKGQCGECKMIKYEDGILLSISAVSNSGVVDDRQVAFGMTVYDRSPINLYSLGSTFGKDETGPFCEYGKKLNKDEKIEGSLPANACVLKVNSNGTKEIFVSGVKKVKGMAVDNKGHVYMAVEGMKNVGIRPIANDSDYIYEVEKGEWLGWPDFSGGDPVTSPKFRVNNERVNFILENHITENPKAPLYMYGKPGTITSLAFVDKNNYEKEGLVFFDLKKGKLYFCNDNIVPQEIINTDGMCNISCIKTIGDKMYMLDSTKGVIYCVCDKVSMKNENMMFLLYFAMGIFAIGIVTVVSMERSKKEIK